MRRYQSLYFSIFCKNHVNVVLTMVLDINQTEDGGQEDMDKVIGVEACFIICLRQCIIVVV